MNLEYADLIRAQHHSFTITLSVINVAKFILYVMFVIKINVLDAVKIQFLIETTIVYAIYNTFIKKRIVNHALHNVKHVKIVRHIALLAKITFN